MRRLTCLVAGCLVLAGCTEEPPAVVEAPPPPELTRADCYTVVLFDEVEITKPGPEVPEPHRAFVGNWTNGAWNGKWCHDLLVSEVRTDGTVELFDMHAPFEDWGQPATAFRRKGRIDEEGNLRFRYGTESVAYRIVDGRMHATRSGRFGDLAAVLVNGEAPERDLAGVPLAIVKSKTGG